MFHFIIQLPTKMNVIKGSQILENSNFILLKTNESLNRSSFISLSSLIHKFLSTFKLNSLVMKKLMGNVNGSRKMNFHSQRQKNWLIRKLQSSSKELNQMMKMRLLKQDLSWNKNVINTTWVKTERTLSTKTLIFKENGLKFQHLIKKLVWVPLNLENKEFKKTLTISS